MVLVVPNVAESRMLEMILNKTAPTDLDIRLYANNVVPTEADTEATYTEFTGGGYAAIQLDSASWTITPGNPSISEHIQVTWVFTSAADTAYGYYIVRRTDGGLMWAERFTDGPYIINQNNDQIRVLPRLTLE